MTDIRSALKTSVKSVTKSWSKAKRHADRQDRLRDRDIDRLAQRYRPVTIKDAAYAAMQDAYLKASAGNTLPTNARQVMYAARPLVLDQTGGECWKQSSYFTQHLLPDFMAQYPSVVADWDVVFDARGHFVEPHTHARTDLGTLDVRRYLGEWHAEVSDELAIDLGEDARLPTKGPAHRYRFALFIEKEGFNALLKASNIANRYDLAIMSTKGMSNTAARHLVEQLSNHAVTILVVRDFDVSGFSIVHTLRSNTRRYRFRRKPKVVDLGLGLDDAAAMGLESEPVNYRNQKDPRIRLRECGATEDECDYLVEQGGWRSWTGARIELNAMDSGQFIEWLEARLTEVGVTKVVPNADVLIRAYRRAYRRAALQEAVDRLLEDQDEDYIPVPADLEQATREQLVDSAQAWDDVIWKRACEDVETSGM